MSDCVKGLWGQRMWVKFMKNYQQGREFIEFDEFVFTLCKLD
jgi:hypothetical protein